MAIDDKSNTYIIDFQLGPRNSWLLGVSRGYHGWEDPSTASYWPLKSRMGATASLSMPFQADFVSGQAIDVIHQPAVQHLGYLQQNLGERAAVSAR